MEEEQFDMEIQALHLLEENITNGNHEHVTSSSPDDRKFATRQHWKDAAKKALHLSDPWEEFHLEDLPTEIVRRYRFNAVRQTWITDEVLVKVAKEPFSHGAMRACFRLRKLSTFCHRQNWKTASNYVAKKYMEDVDRSVYFEDVKLQCDAKLWGEEYNRHNPPKKVDIFQMSVIEFFQRPGKPVFHLEHFIEGDYIKYNSNSGFISCEKMRLTPHAFSHFTFERSGHELIVVDIQGVGDLYTDPQIHTACGKGYGDGNLGTRGMALFFHSHVCNKICESLGLSSFDMSSSETAFGRKLSVLQLSSKTQVRGTEDLCISPSYFERTHWKEFLRSRCSSHASNSPPMSPSFVTSDSASSRISSGFISGSYESDHGYENENIRGKEEDEDDEEEDAGIGPDYGSFQNGSGDSEKGSYQRGKRQRCESECSVDEKEILEFQELVARKSRPSCVHHEVQLRKLQEDGYKRSGRSVLGQIHMDLAKYYELGRFSEGSEDYDHDSAFHHLKHAASCGNLEAIIVMARIHLQLPHDLLTAIAVNVSVENTDFGIEYLTQAAHAGDRASMIILAKFFETGEYVKEMSWNQSVYWYERALTTEEVDEGGEYDNCIDDPSYELLSRQAELYCKGGYGLTKDPAKAAELYQAAAECAMSCMKGKLANKYYMKAEAALSECGD